MGLSSDPFRHVMGLSSDPFFRPASDTTRTFHNQLFFEREKGDGFLCESR
jgi:hypothetical protein